MDKKILLIVNPKAGKGTIKRKVPKIIGNFSKQGYDIETCYTRIDYKPKDILEENKNEKFDVIICCGGDGTLNELINGIMKYDKKPRISFIPLGTVNDFARTIKMSTKRTFLSKNINESEVVESDIGSFNNTYFNYVAAFGAFTPVAYVTGQKLKKKFGKFAYFLVAFKYLNKIKTYDLEVETDKDKFKGEFVYGSVSNSKSIGGFEWFKRKGVKIDDGKFEVLLIRKPKRVIDWINTAILLVAKKHKNKYFYYTQTEKITFKSNQGINWTLDGEYGGRNKEADIRTNNKAINFVIPQ